MKTSSARVVVKTLLRDIKVCLVKEVTDVRRDEDNHGGSPQFFPCPHCTISFTDCYFLENHIKTKHQKQYLAMLRSQVSKSKRVYGPTHLCPHCSCMFHTPRQLDIHNRQAHPSARPQKPAPPRRTGLPHRVQEKFHTCPQCSRRFKYLGSLLKHCKSLHKMAVVLTNGHISCADCEKSFENCWGLGPHRCHEPEGNKPKDAKQMVIKEVGFQCLDCGKILTTPTSLNAHMRIHTGERPFECSECHKRFICSASLTLHMRTHTHRDVKPYSCQECGKSFYEQSHVNGHMKIHKGKRYSCPHCFLSFARKSNLSKHLLRRHKPK
ncbi:gastrula zinc finger protein XlCGF7.1-like isoform X2 [Oncorhynchus nerka]|uniref:gastrula zinc finger protein XlCGF7.1-like isoform X2 n=1 Tax=Oncorhynchus nerka TaxID=8023 RepID=UPI0031B85409